MLSDNPLECIQKTYVEAVNGFHITQGSFVFLAIYKIILISAILWVIWIFHIIDSHKQNQIIAVVFKVIFTDVIKCFFEI